MNTQDILNIVLSTGIIIIVICIVFFTYFFVKALKSVIELTDSLEQTTQNIKEKLQMKALAIIPAILLGILGRIFKKKEVK